MVKLYAAEISRPAGDLGFLSAGFRPSRAGIHDCKAEFAARDKRGYDRRHNRERVIHLTG
jgi:hypothetical protein